MTYDKQAAAFDWRRWDMYRSRQEAGDSVPRIAAMFGRSPCDVRRILEEGARLEQWRPKKDTK